MWASLRSSSAFVSAETARIRHRDAEARERDAVATREIEDRLLRTVYEDWWRVGGHRGAVNEGQ